MDTKIRNLKYSDRLKLSSMIKKLTVKLEDDTLLRLVSSSDSKNIGEEKDEGREDNFIKIGINIFKLLIEFLEEDIACWFADLCNMSIDEFKEKAPFDIEILIIEQLMEDKGKFKSFLAGASKLYSRIGELRNRLTSQKGK